MTDFIDAVSSPRPLLIALLVFGLAPGLALRLIVLAFHRDDPRRQELLAELYTVPRLERPFWVFEQLEVALCEGVWERIVWAATGRIVWRWRLDSGVEMNRQYPETFEIPTVEEKRALRPGCMVKLMFMLKDGSGERMWVRITESAGHGHHVGALSNTPAFIPRLEPGTTVRFNDDHVIDINWSSRDPDAFVDQGGVD
jgi:hypothetical protein